MIRPYDLMPISIQNVGCTYAGWQRARSRFTPYFHETLNAWVKTGASSTKVLETLQQARLVQLANRARRFSPHYAAMKLPEFAANVDAAKGIGEILAAFPVLEKADYRDAPESLIASDIPTEKLIRGKTSGTTGTALPLWYTSEALAEEYAAVWRLRRNAGIG